MQRGLLPAAVIVAGPTASGKSALALDLARRLGGTVINADAMQVYRELHVVTARPDAAAEAAAPHRLYGVRAAAEPANLAWWREAALAAMAEARQAGRLPILCGGTGLYLLSLTEGLSGLPPVPPAARVTARDLLATLGAAGLHERLATVDAETAATLRPTDSQRVARAFELWLGTGRGLRAWQRSAPHTGPAPWRFAACLLDPPRPTLRQAIEARFVAMLAAGALAEVRALLALGLDASLPAMRAHGVPELARHLEGRLTLDAARRQAVLHTGQYTKRQATWFRHHVLADPPDTHIIHARYEEMKQFSESLSEKILAFVDRAR